MPTCPLNLTHQFARPLLDLPRSSLTFAHCFHEVANSFSLFAARAKQKPFPLNRFHTLLQNTGGGGIPTGTSFNHYFDSVSNSSSLPYILPSSLSSKPYVS